MYLAKWTQETGWKSHGAVPFGNLSMPPSAQVLNYGQGLFEGMKALTSIDGRVVLFRPVENAKRMKRGAERMSMKPLPHQLFLRGVTELVEANKTHVRTDAPAAQHLIRLRAVLQLSTHKHICRRPSCAPPRAWLQVPPLGKGGMYLRPLLLGTGGTLGLAPAPEVTFVIYSAAVGSYFAGGVKPIQLKVEDAYHRAAPGGVGAAKCAGASRAHACGAGACLGCDCVPGTVLAGACDPVLLERACCSWGPAVQLHAGGALNRCIVRTGRASS
jgi:branched-chain amino acid aminotransferase